MTTTAAAYQGGLEQVSTVDRISTLTGVRALAALAVMGTHAAYGTGRYSDGYIGLVYARLDIGVAIFFVLSGFLLFRPWVKAAATGGSPPRVRRYAQSRFRRIFPAYAVTVVLAYIIYEFRTAGPSPGHTWTGLIRNLTLTQIYSGNHYLHQGLTQMWSLAVEVAFYVALPMLAYLLMVLMCRRCWRPVSLLVGLGVLAALSPLWLVVLHTTDLLPAGAVMWLPHYLVWFVGGMALAVLRAVNVRCYALVVIPLAVVSYLIVSTPIAGQVGAPSSELGQALARTLFYAVIATLLVAPLALGDPRTADGQDPGIYARLLGSRPMVWLGEISYEIFLVHVIVMEIAMASVLRWPIYTGSVLGLFVVTLAMSIPLAWLLHRLTRPNAQAVVRRQRQATAT